MVREIRGRLDAIARRKVEKREERKKALDKRRGEKKRDGEEMSKEDFDLQTTKHPVKSSQMAWLKGCFWWK